MKASVTRVMYLVGFLTVLSYALLAFPKGMHAWQEKQRQIRDMELRNATLAQEVDRKRQHIKRLSDDAAEQELEIRKRLKLAHPDEKIYILGEPEKQ